MEKIMVQGRCFIDDFGRERIFNGVNLVHKNDDDPDTGRKPVRSYIPTWAPYEIETLARRGVNIRTTRPDLGRSGATARRI